MLRLVLFALAALGAAHPARGAEPDKIKPGPHAVETSADLVLADAARKKELPYKVHFPKDGGPFPVILFSHGFGSNKDTFAPVTKHWASNGYVVIHVTHADGARGKGDATQPRPAGGLLGGLSDPQKIGDRVADLVLVLDALDKLPAAVPALKGKCDAERVGVAGHSFGAYTAMLIGGATADLGTEKAKSFRDKRVKCVMPISAQGTGQQGLTEKSWDALQVPMLTVTGTRDQGAGGQGVEWKKEPYKYSPKGDKYLLVIDGANHVSFGGALGARGAAATDLVKLSGLHFWDAHLTGAPAALKVLRSDKLVTDGKSTFEWK